MLLLIGFLTVVLVLDCLLLILLVLIQLPKKEAGAGLAFGGAATDALFGAGTGNVLTKATKYGTIAFFILLFVIGGLQSAHYNKSSKKFSSGVDAAGKSLPPANTPAAAPVPPVTTITNLESFVPTNTAPSSGTSAPVAPK